MSGALEIRRRVFRAFEAAEVEVATLAGTSWPFATAAWVLGALSGASIGAAWLRQVTVAQGARAAAQTETTAAAVSRQEVEVRVGLAGGWLRSRDTARGLEGKVGVVATGRERSGRTRGRWCGRRDGASFRWVATFAALVYQAGCRSWRGAS